MKKIKINSRKFRESWWRLTLAGNPDDFVCQRNPKVVVNMDGETCKKIIGYIKENYPSCNIFPGSDKHGLYIEIKFNDDIEEALYIINGSEFEIEVDWII